MLAYIRMMDCFARAENLTMKALVFLALIGAACKTLYQISFFSIQPNLVLLFHLIFFGAHSSAYVSNV